MASKKVTQGPGPSHEPPASPSHATGKPRVSRAQWLLVAVIVEEWNAEYETAVRLDHPRTADCWYYVGKNYLRREQAGPAKAAFERAGGIPGARYEVALLLARAGELSQADAEARRLSEEFPAA